MRNAIIATAFMVLIAGSALAQDNFNSGSTQGWGIGNVTVPPNPSVIADGGPNGAGDGYLRYESTGGSGTASRFVIFKDDFPWAGNWTTIPLNTVEFDVINLGATQLDLRVAVDGPGGRFVTTQVETIAPGSGWVSLSFAVLPFTVTAVGGTDIDATLAGVTQTRILSAVNPSWNGDQIAAIGGFNDIGLQEIPNASMDEWFLY